MDSLSQIVLGAAVGELCLGKKLGNRAMVWGAIGGTIPDLDVLSSQFLNELEAQLFHRSVTHSILFSVLFSFVMAWITNKIYRLEWYKTRSVRWAFYGLSILLIGMVLYGVNTLVHTFSNQVSITLLVLSILTLSWFVWRWYKRYIKQGHDLSLPSYFEWYGLFFWAFFTHIILDSFTTYGTQVFWPFSNWRVAFSNISVADPLYTLPFLILLILASAFYRSDRRRTIFNLAGILISSFYIAFTLINYFKVKAIFEDSLRAQDYNYERIMVSPTIFNNVLWNGIAQNEDDEYYYSRYSFYDKSKDIQFKTIDGKHHLKDSINSSKVFSEIRDLEWFSNGYYVLELRDTALVFNDLRFGTSNDEREVESKFVFRFVLYPDDSTKEARIERGNGEDRSVQGMEKGLKELWNRMMGR